MLSLEEISDRLEIQQLLVDYSTAIDTRKFDDLDRVFTEDAYIDYRAMGGIDGQFPDVKAWLAEVLPNFPAYSHLIGNFDVRISGDTASSRVICFNPMTL
ncbi:MAG TPA: nuclear transport factor 2 family protein, partial [Mycobacterium sp.]|nr:nuclear transport factor 2 family protein [Mycobacterium sp.]